MIFKLGYLVLFSGLVYSSAIPKNIFPLPPISSRSAAGSAEAILLQIAPASSTCAGAEFTSECETAGQAAPFLIAAFGKYQITNPYEMAAVASQVAYETSEFKYNINHSPGRAGQGTRNMQRAKWNLLYAKSIPALATQLSAITTASTVDGLSDAQLNQIRALVLPDQYSWASAAWFLTTNCASSRPAIQAGGQAGFAAYMTCLSTPASSDRQAYYTKAVTAFGAS
jgi:hypothetical protein